MTSSLKFCKYGKLIFLWLLFPVFLNAQGFVHPGGLHTKKDLDFVKEQINENNQPWKDAYDQFLTLRASRSNVPKVPFTSLEYTHDPHREVVCGFFNDPNIGCNQFIFDGAAAYSMALRFYITEDKRYADQAKKILMDWENEVRELKDLNARLIASWATPWYTSAAEILRYTPTSGWSNFNTNEFNKFLNIMKQYLFWTDKPANNWMASAIEARFAIAIFQDDRAAFNDAVKDWKFRFRTYIYQKSDGNKPVNPLGFTTAQTERLWRHKAGNPNTAYIDGLTMETCRDINHTKLGVMSFFYGAEMAWSQGEDLFDLEKKRMKDFMELHSGWWLGEKIPSNICEGTIDWKQGREETQIAFELIYNHLHDRLGMSLPKTLNIINRNRVTGASPWVRKWETLFYADRSFATNEAPVISITSPNNGNSFTVGEEIILKANASDPDGNLDKVNFKINNDFYKTVINRPFEATYTPEQPGEYIIGARAFDKEGLFKEVTITINVKVPNRQPTVTITSPSDNETFILGETITLKANASDPDGNLEKVNFKINNDFYKTVVNRPFETTFTPDSAGNYVIGARAFDKNNLSTEKTVNIKVVDPALSSEAFFKKNKTKLKVYPSPAQNTITIEGLFNDINQLNIIDITGKTVINHQLNKNYSTIKIENLANGIYFIKILNSKSIKTISFIKN